MAKFVKSRAWEPHPLLPGKGWGLTWIQPDRQSDTPTFRIRNDGPRLWNTTRASRAYFMDLLLAPSSIRLGGLIQRDRKASSYSFERIKEII